MPGVAIVTDSTCDLGPTELASLGVTMVPLKVLFGEESYLDWIELLPVEFFDRLKRSPILPKTSQPSPADFSAVYERLASEGYDSIVSIHLSAVLSGTCESALLAAKDCKIPVHVLDTKEVCLGVALVVKAAVEAAATGMDGEGVAKIAQEVAERTSLYFVLDTLDYLVKGGRAGKAQGLAASILNIKAVLSVNDDGIIEPYAKERGRKKALQVLAKHVADVSKERGQLRVAYLHANAPKVLAELQHEIEASGADVVVDTVGLIGAVIGTYAGPDAVGITFYPLG
jgi:DegV family protein with EDD domain